MYNFNLCYLNIHSKIRPFFPLSFVSFKLFCQLAEHSHVTNLAHTDHTFWFCLSSRGRSLLGQAGLLPVSWILVSGDCLLPCPWGMVLKRLPALRDPSTFRSISPGNLTDLIPWAALIPPHGQGGSFPDAFPPVIRDFKLDCFVVTVAKMATNRHFPYKTLSSSNRSWRTLFRVALFLDTFPLEPVPWNCFPSVLRIFWTSLYQLCGVPS